jgi:hypothetical protein
MAIPPVITINTVEDLYRILTLKRIISRRAHEELLNIAGDKVLQINAIPSLEDTLQFISEERKLLNKYASYPSLTEWNLMPELHSGTKWGSTFGVTILVGELILENLRQLHAGFSLSILQKMFMAILGELNKPSTVYLVDSIHRMTNFNVERADGQPLDEKDKEAFVHQVLTQILESFVSISEKYGLVEEKGPGVSITPLGQRVLLHLKDASDFVIILTEAHTRLQTEKPRLPIA